MTQLWQNTASTTCLHKKGGKISILFQKQNTLSRIKQIVFPEMTNKYVSFTFREHGIYVHMFIKMR